MQIVVDTSAVLAVLLGQPERETILSLTAGCDLIAPASMTAEIGNALSALFKKRHITLEQAEQVLANYDGQHLRFCPLDLPRSVRIAHDLGIYAYDAYMVELAERMRCHLLTLDQRLVSHSRNYGLRVLEV